MTSTHENIPKAELGEITVQDAREQIERDIARYVHEYDEDTNGSAFMLERQLKVLKDPESLQTYVDVYNRNVRAMIRLREAGYREVTVDEAREALPNDLAAAETITERDEDMEQLIKWLRELSQQGEEGIWQYADYLSVVRLDEIRNALDS